MSNGASIAKRISLLIATEIAHPAVHCVLAADDLFCFHPATSWEAGG
jgi:sorbitol-specific phosphotransferase system component IIBC